MIWVVIRTPAVVFLQASFRTRSRRLVTPCSAESPPRSDPFSDLALPVVSGPQPCTSDVCLYRPCRHLAPQDPANDFRPDTGLIEVFRAPGGMGIRIDDGPGFVGANITPYYDSLLIKVTARAATRADAITKLQRALKEFRVR